MQVNPPGASISPMNLDLGTLLLIIIAVCLVVLVFWGTNAV